MGPQSIKIMAPGKRFNSERAGPGPGSDPYGRGLLVVREKAHPGPAPLGPGDCLDLQSLPATEPRSPVQERLLPRHAKRPE